jgi:alkaline phosphatase D
MLQIWKVCAAGACCLSAAAACLGSTGAVRIALVADPHVTLGAGKEQYQQNLMDTIHAVNQANVDQVLIAGDLVDGGSDRVNQYARYAQLIAGFNAPVLAVAGNHDVGDKISPAVPNSTLTDKRLDAYLATNSGPLWFSQTIVPGVRVVGATSSLMGSGLAREADQWTFLQNSLTPVGGERVILLMHNPAFISAADEDDSYWNLDVAPRAQLLTLLDGTGDLVLSGHYHRPLDSTDDDIRFIGAPSVAFGLGPVAAPVGWTLITLNADGSMTSQVQAIPEPAVGMLAACMIGGLAVRRRNTAQ